VQAEVELVRHRSGTLQYSTAVSAVFPIVFDRLTAVRADMVGGGFEDKAQLVIEKRIYK
jgi:hypothetical protein